MIARSCRDVRADLSAYLDVDLDIGRASDLDIGLSDAIRAHLETCAGCRSELEQLRLTADALRRLPELPPPAAILTGVRARLWPEPWYRRLLEGRRWPPGMPIGALATVLVIVGIAFFQARHPDMTKTVTHGPLPQEAPPPARETLAKSTPIAPPASDGRSQIAERRSPPANRSLTPERQPAPPPAPARRDLRAKGTLGPAVLPQVASREKEAADADKKDGFRAAPFATVESGAQSEPLAPVEPVSSTGITGGANKVEQVRPATPAPRVAAMKDALREEAPRVDNLEAAPSRSVVSKQTLAAAPVPAPAAAPAYMANEYPAGKPALADDRPMHGSAALDEVESKSRTSISVAAKRKESRAVLRRNANSGADLRSAEIAGEKAAEPTWIEVVCLLSPDGDTVDDLERLLRREGASNVAVVALEPWAVREAFTRHRGRFAVLSEPSRGWTVTAGVAPGELARLLEVLGSHTSLRLLGQPTVPAVPQDSSAALDLRITVLR